MDPKSEFCPNLDCSARGIVGAGNIGVHSHKEKRYICYRCGKTFAATKGTLFYRRQYGAILISQIVSLLAYGCPLQAIVATFEVDERTVADWQQAAGAHCQQVHQAVVQQGQLDMKQVQADEIRVKTQRQVFWIAMAIAVTTRLWLGGVVGQIRDTGLVLALALQVKACALCRLLLICFDGFAGYIKAFRQAFRRPLRTGKVGRPRLIPWPGIVLGQVVKQYAKGRVVGIARRIIQGTKGQVQHLLTDSQSGGVLNNFLHRTIKCHLPSAFGKLGAPRTGAGSNNRNPGSWYIFSRKRV